ncbi:MAG TPA: flavin reductase family protein, partial [Gemmatimonadales bacterium]|nr:flavin reductase family protein [Gemmatimonadales bacterium]
VEDARICGLCEEGAEEVASHSMQPIDLFRRLTAGVYVIGVAEGSHRDAFTAAWVTQVSFDPLLIALSIHPEHASYPLLHATGAFTINILPTDRIDLAGHYGTVSGRDRDKLQGQAWRPSTRGCPILMDAIAAMECESVAEYPAGDHVLVVARVTGGELFARDAEPLGYRATGDLDGSAALYPSSFRS